MRKPPALTLVLLVLTAVSLQGQPLPSPEQFAGYPIGSDGNLIEWDRIVDYLQAAGRASDRILVEEPGKTNLDKPFLLLTVSDNLSRLDEILRSEPAHMELARGAADQAQHPFDRDRLVADGARARPSTCDRRFAMDAKRPRQRRVPSGSVDEPRQQP